MSEISSYRDFLLLREKALDVFMQQVAEAETTGRTLSCVIFDIDHFYALKETHGDSAMESLLQQVLSLLKQSKTDTCLVDSFGRDEFFAILWDMEIEQALLFADQLRRKLAAAKFKLTNTNEEIHITASGGVASFPADAKDGVELIRKAEEALYKAKRRGRDQVSLPPNDALVIKTNYYSKTQLEKLALLAKKVGRTEASLLREALDNLLTRHNM